MPKNKAKMYHEKAQGKLEIHSGKIMIPHEVAERMIDAVSTAAAFVQQVGIDADIDINEAIACPPLPSSSGDPPPPLPKEPNPTETSFLTEFVEEEGGWCQVKAAANQHEMQHKFLLFTKRKAVELAQKSDDYKTKYENSENNLSSARQRINQLEHAMKMFDLSEEASGAKQLIKELNAPIKKMEQLSKQESDTAKKVVEQRKQIDHLSKEISAIQRNTKPLLDAEAKNKVWKTKVQDQQKEIEKFEKG